MNQLRTATLRPNAINAIVDAYRKGDYAGALQAAEALKSNPEHAALYFFFSGAMLMHLGRLEEAEPYLRRNLTAASDTKLTAVAYSSLGQLLLEMQRYDEAFECFQTSLGYWPDRGSCHRDIAEAWLRRGDNTSYAVEWALRGVQLERSRDDLPDSPEGRELCNIDLAEDLATAAWAIAADSRDRSQVDRLVDEALTLLSPASLPAARVRHTGKEMTFSVTLLSPATAPTAQVHYHAGRAYLALGDSSKSDRHFEEAARIDPHGLWGRSARSLMDRVTA
jgi:tetratricopeptide (TPR) repeat protein